MQKSLLFVIMISLFGLPVFAVELAGPPAPLKYFAWEDKPVSHPVISAPLVIGNVFLWGTELWDKSSTESALARCPTCREDAVGWSTDWKTNLGVTATSVGLEVALRKQPRWLVRELVPFAIPVALGIIHVQDARHNRKIK